MIWILAANRSHLSLLSHSWDYTRDLRDATCSTVSGFHTTLERECLDILLKGTQPITIVPARTYSPGQWLYGGETWKAIRQGLDRGNVTIKSPPGVTGNRVTKENAEIRNAYLLEIADVLLVLSAPPDSKTRALALKALGQGMPVFTFEHAQHEALFAAGAQVATIDAIVAAIRNNH